MPSSPPVHSRPEPLASRLVSPWAAEPEGESEGGNEGEGGREGEGRGGSEEKMADC